MDRSTVVIEAEILALEEEISKLVAKEVSSWAGLDSANRQYEAKRVQLAELRLQRRLALIELQLARSLALHE
jgi:hypothetical protein